jgi:outer membrane protein assembly factor BamB
MTGAAIAVADHPSVEQLGGDAAKYVPSEGHVEWLVDNLDVARMSESARTIGYEDILQLPTQAGVAIFGWLGDDSRTAQLWRESTITIGGGEPDQVSTQTTDLHQLSVDGLSLLTGYGGSFGLAYSPPLLELPAHVAPGVIWSSAGDARPNGLMTYTAKYEASVPSSKELLTAAGLSSAELAGCLQTNGSAVYLDDAGETILDIVEANLWCEGRGRVAIVATVNDSLVVQGPMTEPPGPGNWSSSAVQPTWGSGRDWLAVEAAPVYLDAFFGEQQLTISLMNPPRRTQSGLIVAVNQIGDDVVALGLESGALVRQWFAHPGGEIITLATAGELTIVTTSQRKVLAYSESGQRLWERATQELVLAPPTDAGNGALILVGLDGTVSSIDLISGELDWERRLSADVVLSAAVDGDRVLVADRAGAITAFDLVTGATLWTDDSARAPASVFATDGVVVVTGDDGFLRAYDAATGARLWAQRYTGFIRAAVDLDGCALFVTTETTGCINVATGVVQWTRAGAQDAVTDGVRAVLFDEAAAHLVDATGATIAEWGIPSLALAINRYAVAGGDGFWVFRSYQPALAVGQP